jgi:pilus assembly protein CpaC
MLPLTNHAQETQTLEIETGASVVLKATDLQRIAVGNSQVVQASEINGREVIVFGKTKGATTVELWLKTGRRKSYLINVKPSGLSRIHREINTLLASIPNARSSIVGEKIVIEGEDLGDSDQSKIARFAARYPEVLDLTSQLGWDRMVLLDVQVIEIPSSRMQELGVRWDPGSSSSMHTGVAWEGASSLIGQRPGESLLDVPFPLKHPAGYFGLNALLNARLAALSKSGEAVILAQPQLLARSGSTASFLAGGEVPYASVDKDGKSTTTFKKYGVSLNITPNVDRHGAVRSKIEIEVSAVDTTISVPGGPAMKIRKASTEFNVRSGQTLVLGGFLSRERSTDRDGIPGASEIPILGGLFGVNREMARQTELAIFVTPVVVDADHPQMHAQVKSGREIVSNAFPESPRFQHPIQSQNHSQVQFQHQVPLQANDPERSIGATNHSYFSGSSSQWETAEEIEHQHSASLHASQWEDPS